VSGFTLTEILQNIRVVLVRPKGSGNIGSVARAMKNTGLRDLALVGGGRTDSLSARAMAVGFRNPGPENSALPMVWVYCNEMPRVGNPVRSMVVVIEIPPLERMPC